MESTLGSENHDKPSGNTNVLCLDKPKEGDEIWGIKGNVATM